MADKNIYIETDINNIFIINPNKVFTSDGKYEDRVVPHEQLIMYANLECDIQPRSRLITGDNGTNLRQIASGSINFLRPNNQNYLTTNWSKSQSEVNDPNTINGELLGITSINYKVGMSMAPLVTISLEDSKGRALFEGGNSSIYSAFFNLPYPTFFLTLKGYYGKAVRYQLNLTKFSSSFNQSTSNFEITLNFQGHQFGVLNDVNYGEVLAAPQMYTSRTTENKAGQTPSNLVTNNGQNANVVNKVNQKGFEKIKQVYQDYKNKGLINPNFPEITITELTTILENFIASKLKNFGQVSVETLNDIAKYKEIVEDFKKDIITSVSPQSWTNLYLDKESPFYYTTEATDGTYTNEIPIYTFKKQYTSGLQITAYNELVSKFKTFQTKLKSVKTFASGPYAIRKEVIVENIAIDTTAFSKTTIDVDLTFRKRNAGSTPTTDQLNTLKSEINLLFPTSETLIDNGGITPTNILLYDWEGPKKFNDAISEIEVELAEQEQKIQDDLSEKLAKVLKTTDSSGFSPTIRNIIAVIMASCEGFLRLLSEVHKKAFDERDNSKKKQSVIGDLKSQKSPVYPWPQYAVTFTDKNKNSRVEQQYPGDPKYIKSTNGNDYKIWPEVEFVEEFVKGFIQKQFPPINPTTNLNGDAIQRLLISAFETIPTNIPYSDSSLNNFKFEYAQRLRLISQYNNFKILDEDVIDFIASSETENILKGVISKSIDIPIYLKNTAINNIGILESELNATGDIKKYTNYIYGNIVVDYLASDINSTFEIYKNDLPSVSLQIDEETKFGTYISSKKHNVISQTDTYPFVIEEWNRVNLAYGKENYTPTKVINTNNSLFYNGNIKKIANYINPLASGKNGDKKTNRPITNFKVFKNQINITNNFSLDDFYNNRYSNEVFTEGQLNAVNSLFRTNQTTSILNTPYFINALQEGVSNDKEKVIYAYKKASYLFLNSLPLSTLRERYKSDDGSGGSDLDYIASTIRKFGAVHVVPKMWAAKLGSVWSRYKTWKSNGVDYMFTVFKDFNAFDNYDPINSDPTKSYIIEGANSGEDYTFVLQNVSSGVVNGSNTITGVTQNVGFYPKLLNDFYYFINGESIYLDSLDIEFNISNLVATGTIIFKNPSSSNISAIDADSGIIDFKGWSILIKDKNIESNYIPSPSFGSIVNQLTYEACTPPANINVRNNFNFQNNNAIFNGSIRTFWAAPNFGYFDTTGVKLTSPDQYMKLILSGESLQPSFNLLGNGTDNYTNIEEIFAVFTKTELDGFEEEFNKFSQSNGSTIEEFTFQKIFKNMMSSNYEIALEDIDKTILNIQNKQMTNILGILPAEINTDIIFKKGNPEDFDYKTFSIVSNTPLEHSTDNLLTYSANTLNSLPRNGGKTLDESKLENPEEWKTLELYVGFSTLPGFVYSNSGSYITDFFTDLDIAFTVENIKRFSGLIKIYATCKYNNYSVNEFKTIISNNISGKQTIANNIINSMDTKLHKKLPTYSEGGNYQTKRDVTEGMQSKFEYYDMFKVLNDKWVAGNNYEEQTLFEDFLFFDRANRDVGNDVYVDVIKLKSYLNGVDPTTNLYVLIDSIVRDAHFVPFVMPAYINFYNIQRPGENGVQYNPDDFANSLFGTYTTVDYQNSRTKYICCLPEEPSTQLNNPDTINGFNDDGLYFEKPGDNTLISDDGSKTNTEKALSNKVCGFAIDFGMQNQSVFEGIQLAQDIGQPTSESLKSEYDLANLNNGTTSTSQSISLYNIYKQRSYAATVTSMGNAMIQPTMYFALRNVPMFAGTYLIQDVSHTVTPDSFRTTFTGIRQKISTFPAVDNILLSINREILSNIAAQQKQQQQIQSPNTNNVLSNNASIAANYGGNKPAATTPICKPVPSAYSNYVRLQPIETQDTSDNILSAMTNMGLIKNVQEIIYNLFTIGSWTGNGFKGFYYNYASIPLDMEKPFGGSLNDLFFKGFVCVMNSKNEQVPNAAFIEIEKSIDFCRQKYAINMIKAIGNNYGDAQSFADKFVRAYIEYFPYTKVNDNPNIYDDFYNSNEEDVIYLRSIVKKNYNLFR